MKKIISIQGKQALNIMPGIEGNRSFPKHGFGVQDPFIMLDHIGPKHVGVEYFAGGKEGAHPHRGFETMTMVFEGYMKHIDSLGNEEVLHSGDVQRMHAGSGIIHGGDMRSDQETGVFNEIQLWVNVPTKDKMVAPEVQKIAKADMPLVEKNGLQIKTIAGDWGYGASPAQNHANIGVLEINAIQNASATVETFKNNETALIYVLKGSIMADGHVIEQFQTGVLDQNEGSVEITLNEGSQIIVLKGEPINEPVALGGPFVMNTEEEIKQAYADFRAGAFGTV